MIKKKSENFVKIWFKVKNKKLSDLWLKKRLIWEEVYL